MFSMRIAVLFTICGAQFMRGSELSELPITIHSAPAYGVVDRYMYCIDNENRTCADKHCNPILASLLLCTPTTKKIRKHAVSPTAETPTLQRMVIEAQREGCNCANLSTLMAWTSCFLCWSGAVGLCISQGQQAWTSTCSQTYPVLSSIFATPCDAELCFCVTPYLCFPFTRIASPTCADRACFAWATQK